MAPALTFKVIVPTLNAAADWGRFAPALLAAVQPEQVLIVDSASTDGTADLALAAGFSVLRIPRAEFNHGGTRQLAAEASKDDDILVYMTQDAVLADAGAIAALVAAFEDPQVAAAYGRQLPRPGAGSIETHARLFNYPADPDLRALDSRERLGIKAAFISNSFAAYRRGTLISVGGFPKGVIFGEDTITAAKLLTRGHKIAYVAGACVYHSHSYSWAQDFKRYFDIGVLHSRERWLLHDFGAPGGEGRRFVASEVKFLWGKAPGTVPSALIRTAVKLLGYGFGKREARLPRRLKAGLSMNRTYWR